MGHVAVRSKAVTKADEGSPVGHFNYSRWGLQARDEGGNRTKREGLAPGRTKRATTTEVPFGYPSVVRVDADRPSGVRAPMLPSGNDHLLLSLFELQ